ncbi:MAG: ribonucleotide reductase N-terminal alpha domain-containing protein, partial [Alphaproteobacteria bacterium]
MFLVCFSLYLAAIFLPFPERAILVKISIISLIKNNHNPHFQYNMQQNLFAQIEEQELIRHKKKDLFKKVLEGRERPKPPHETSLITPSTKIDEPILEKKTKKAFPRKDVFKKSVEYFGGDELAATVWMAKYSLKNSAGDIFELTPDDMHHRIASEIARIEKKYPNPLTEVEIYEVLKDFKYIVPQGSPMAGIGNNFQVSSLSNCFVIGSGTPSDSYGGIMKIDQEQVQLMKRRGGVGHDLSHIRPKGSPVKNSALSSTGIVPFMERYSNSTREVAQDGRRGALMLTVSIKHPDVEDFIDAKMELGKVTGANVSVKIDDEFMQAVKDGTSYKHQYPINSDNPTFVKSTDARQLWGKIIHNAWKSAEP